MFKAETIIIAGITKSPVPSSMVSREFDEVVWESFFLFADLVCLLTFDLLTFGFLNYSLFLVEFALTVIENAAPRLERDFASSIICLVKKTATIS